MDKIWGTPRSPGRRRRGQCCVGGHRRRRWRNGWPCCLQPGCRSRRRSRSSGTTITSRSSALPAMPTSPSRWGSCTPHLRLAQIEVMRRVAYGRVAEMVGPLGIPVDRSLRLMGIGRAVPAIVAGLPDATRDWAASFVSGPQPPYCAGPATSGGVRAAGHPPGAVDTDRSVHGRASRRRRSELAGRLAAAAAAGGALPAAQWAALWPMLLAGGVPAGAPAGPEPAAQVLGATLRAGSNSAAVAGWRSTSGAALIASDPHLGVALAEPVADRRAQLAGHQRRRADAARAAVHRPWGGTATSRGAAPACTPRAAICFDVSGLPAEAFTTREETIRVRWSRPRTHAASRGADGPGGVGGRAAAPRPAIGAALGRPSSER